MCQFAMFVCYTFEKMQKKKNIKQEKINQIKSRFKKKEIEQSLLGWAVTKEQIKY